MKKNGFALVGALIAVLILSILITSLITLTRVETIRTVREKKKTTAFHLAEAGQDRGYWKLKESNTIWNTISSGTAITGYNNDVEYIMGTDGVYKIAITSGPATGQVTITAKGKCAGTQEMRTIRAIYSKGAVLGAMTVSGGIQYKPNLEVQWGPVVTYNSITQSPSQYYPRKYSAGQIVGRDTVNDSNNGAMPSGNWASYDYAAFQDLGTPPTIKLDEYRQKAKNSCVPPLRRGSGSSAAAHYTGGGCDSGYYTENVKINKPGGGSTSYTFSCSTCVIFVEGSVAAMPNDAWLNIEALCVTGNMDFNARSTNYTATLPVDAQSQYQKSPEATSYWTSQGWTNGGTYTIANCGMHGFLYVGGSLSNAGGGSNICGAIYVVGNVTLNTMTVYYDSTVAMNVVLDDAEISRTSWDEIVTTW